jgi:hypothetical protein
VSGLPLELRPSIEAFLANCLAVFDDLDATLLEMNPFTLDPSGKPFPLDIRMVGPLPPPPPPRHNRSFKCRYGACYPQARPCNNPAIV